MTEQPTVTVITPTYNRADSLERTLESLMQQTYAADHYEVVVVDDGSSDHTQEICMSFADFSLRYVLQAHAGGTQAKNTGAMTSLSEFLVFLDDDITVEPQFIEEVMHEHRNRERLIVIGTLRQMAADKTLLRALPRSLPTGSKSTTSASSVAISFTHCLGGCFSIRRSDYLELGMLQDPAPGFWPNWEDVDLGYRASLRGFRFRRSLRAIAYHWDHSYDCLETICRRSSLAARSAARLFQTHPGLRGRLPMFREKEPMSLWHDSPKLLLNKALRRLLWSAPSVFTMQRLSGFLKGHDACRHPLSLLYRWIISAHIYEGYKQGLRELAGDERERG